jgi:hypothetical protein
LRRTPIGSTADRRSAPACPPASSLRGRRLNLQVRISAKRRCTLRAKGHMSSAGSHGRAEASAGIVPGSGRQSQRAGLPHWLSVVPIVRPARSSRSRSWPPASSRRDFWLKLQVRIPAQQAWPRDCRAGGLRDLGSKEIIAIPGRRGLLLFPLMARRICPVSADLVQRPVAGPDGLEYVSCMSARCSGPFPSRYGPDRCERSC